MKTEMLTVKVAMRTLFYGLVEFEMYRQTNRRKHLRNACKNVKLLRKWHENGNPNVEHMVLILKAEMASLGPNANERRSACDAAIQACRRGEFIHNEALANQRAAIFCLNDDDVSSATEYMVKAAALYTEWGALAIAEHIKTKYAYLFYDQMTTSSTRRAIERTKRYNKYLAEQCRLAQSRIKSMQYS